MSTLTAPGAIPIRAPDPPAVRPAPESRPAETAAARTPRPDIEVQKARFEMPPGQVLVVDAGAAPGEGRVTLEQAPDTGSLIDVKY